MVTRVEWAFGILIRQERRRFVESYCEKMRPIKKGWIARRKAGGGLLLAQNYYLARYFRVPE